MSEKVEIVPNRETFNFEAYLNGAATLPEHEHTVYLDQRAGSRLAQAITEYDELAAEGKKLAKRQEIISKNTSSSLVDDDYEEMVDRLQEITERTDALDAEMKDLEEQVRQSGITVHLQIGSAKTVNKVLKKAEKEYVKKHGRGRENDNDYVAERGEYALVSQLAAFCTKVVLPDGSERPNPGITGFEALVEKLVNSEVLRLMMALNEAIGMSDKWAKRIDAGFPGGGTDLGHEPVGDPSPENSTGLVPAAAHPVHREEDHVG